MIWTDSESTAGFTGKIPLKYYSVKRINKCIISFYDGTTPILSVSEPILLKKIMVKDFQCFQDRYPHAHNALRILGKSVFFLPGEQWKRVRSLVTPTFTTYRLKTGLHLTHKCVEGVLGNLNEAAAAGREVDVKRLFGAYTLGIKTPLLKSVQSLITRP